MLIGADIGGRQVAANVADVARLQNDVADDLILHVEIDLIGGGRRMITIEERDGRVRFSAHRHGSESRSVDRGPHVHRKTVRSEERALT
jgi:hypothetical protein